MINPLSIVTGIAMAAIIGHTFEVKRHVGTLDRDLRDIRRATEEVETRTQTLAAEWARLNDQERLRGLAERHLGQMVPMQSMQFVRHDEGVRRLPLAQAWAGEVSPFAPRQETTAAARGPAEAVPAQLATVVPGATRPAIPPGSQPGNQPGGQLAAPTNAETGRPSVRPLQLADAAASRTAPTTPRATPVIPETTQGPTAPLRASTPPMLNPTLPNVAAPPAPAAVPRAAPIMPPAQRPPVLAAVAAPSRLADGAALPLARPAMLAQRVDTGSLLGGQAVAMAPPVPWGR